MNETFIKTIIPETLEQMVETTGLNDNKVWSALDKKFGKNSDHRLLFSTPTQHKNEVIWSTLNEQVIKELKNLTGEEQQNCEKLFVKLSSEIKDYINELNINRKAGDNGKVADFLESALKTPSGELEYVQVSKKPETNSVSIKPFLVLWGYKERKAQASDELPGISAAGTGKKSNPADSGPDNQDEGGSSYKSKGPQGWVWISRRGPFKGGFWYVLLWLMIVGIIGWIMWLLLISCSVNFLKNYGLCVKDHTIISMDVRNQNQLMKQIKGLERDLLIQQKRCKKTDQKIGTKNSKINVETQRRLDATKAQSGEVNVTLSWNNKADLDLNLYCTRGEHISYRKMTKNKNNCGELDVDANYPPDNVTNTPIEHIFIDKAEFGKYKIIVTNRSQSRFKNVEFELTVDKLGEIEVVTQDMTNRKSKNSNQYEYNFVVKKD